MSSYQELAALFQSLKITSEGKRGLKLPSTPKPTLIRKEKHVNHKRLVKPSNVRSGGKHLRHFLWMRDYGNVAEAKCRCCGFTEIWESNSDLITMKGYEREPNNLCLICRQCHLNMGEMDFDEFMVKYNLPITK